MPLQNRVTPLSELVAEPARGLVYGNRGCLHDDEGRIRRPFAGRRWIACRLEFKGWHRSPLLQPGRFTELFFLDEATAFAAGHRPCALCRREDYDRFRRALVGAAPRQTGADAIDLQLHGERFDWRAARAPDARFDDCRTARSSCATSEPWLVARTRAAALDGGGYTDRERRPAAGPARVVTPPSLVSVLRAGWAGRCPCCIRPPARNLPTAAARRRAPRTPRCGGRRRLPSSPGTSAPCCGTA